jgi:hypothetical protein
MIYPLYRKLPLIPTRAAMNELFDNNLDLYTVLDILENGYDCPKSKRAKGTIERCLDEKRKTIRIVVVRSFNYSFDMDVWAITHVGITSKHKQKVTK